jgi:hypothetical protein
MTANLPRPSVDENISSTLAAGITDVATSFDVGDASKIVEPCYMVIDRVDSSGTVKNSSLWEYVKVTGVTSNTLTITRGQGGSTQQSHSSGAVIEAVVTSSMFEDWYNALNPEHTSAGGHVITGTATIANVMMSGNVTAAALGVTDGKITTLTSTGISTANVTVTGYLNVGSASIYGIGLNPTWYIPSLPSLPTTGLGRPVSMPRAGLIQFVSVTLNGIVSSPTVYFDVNKNFGSIFDTGTRPLITNGTFISTASVATKNFKAGDVLSVDYDMCDLGGNSVDATVTVSSF